MTIIEQIKAEIDKRYAEYREKMKTDDFTYYEGMADALDLFEQFIDTLESEKPVPADLEEAADKFAVFYDQGTCDGIAQDCFIAGYKLHEANTPLPEDTVLFNKGIEEGKRLMKESIENHIDELNDKYLGGVYSSYDMAKAYAEGHIDGQKWQKEQMMKDAVKWLVDDDYHEASEKGRFILGSVGLGYNGYYIPYLDLLKLPKED